LKSYAPRRVGAETEAIVMPPLPPNASVGKRWKFRRNVVIYVAYRSGISQRALADVFDLPRSRISTIVKAFSEQSLQ
jgi:hypothetical protein